jgi:hypothetical protein
MKHLGIEGPVYGLLQVREHLAVPLCSAIRYEKLSIPITRLLNRKIPRSDGQQPKRPAQRFQWRDDMACVLACEDSSRN